MMKTRWKNWKATDGQLSAEYEAKRKWAEDKGIRLKFNLYIIFEDPSFFYARVTDWNGDEVVWIRRFYSFDKAFDYLSDVDCEYHVDKKWDVSL